MTSFHFQSPTFAALSAPISSSAMRLVCSLWRSLEVMGQRRAASALRERAVFYASWNPALAAQMRAAAEQCERSR